jgi:uncharacterized protein YodC (DUF2158 family)
MSEISSGPTTFEPGDVVQLKSFGPPMTVVSIEADGVHVVWYGEESDEVKSHVIPAIALEKITVLDDDEDEDEDEDEDDDDDEDEEDHRGRRRGGKRKHRRDD